MSAGEHTRADVIRVGLNLVGMEDPYTYAGEAKEAALGALDSLVAERDALDEARIVSARVIGELRRQLADCRNNNGGE